MRKLLSAAILSMMFCMVMAIPAFADSGPGTVPGGMPNVTRVKSSPTAVDAGNVNSIGGFGELGSGIETPDPVLGIVPEVSYSLMDCKNQSYGAASSRATEGLFAPEGFSKLHMSNSGVVRLYFRTYSEAHGWSPWAMTENNTLGNDDGSKVQAVQIRMKGYMHTMSDICYKAVLNDGTVVGWARNGQTLGTMGTDKYIVGLAVKCWDKNKSFGASTTTMAANAYEGAYLDTSGRAHYSTFDGRAYTGWGWIDNTQYYFENNEPAAGWRYIDGYKYLLNEDGSICSDLEPVTGLPGAYQIRYNKATRTLYIMANDPDGGGFIIPYKTFMSSCGPDTPLGTFKTYARYDWKFMHPSEDGSGDIYCQKLTRFKDGFLMHSLLYYHSPNPFTLDAINYNFIDYAASGGCIRLRACDANWIYSNVPLQTPIILYYKPQETGPVEKDAIMQAIPREQNYDPTDPEALAAIAAGQATQSAADAAAAQAAIEQAAADDAAEGITATE